MPLAKGFMVRLYPRITLCAVLSAPGFPVAIGRAEQLSLQNAAVLIDPGEASYVHHAVAELRQQIKSTAGEAPSLYYDASDARREKGPLLVVGRSITERLAGEQVGIPRITDQEPGPQGFLLKYVRLSDGREAIVAAGSDSAGSNYAVIHLRQLLLESPSVESVGASLDVREKPRYPVRGLYLHQHWRYNYPYAAWSWRVADWKRALDMAACLRVNLVMLWVHMDMIAPPLSVPEQDYLADIREVIEYAHRKRGIKIWLVEAPNVLLDQPAVKRLPLEDRDYYAYAHMQGGGLKNPGDPKGLAALLANREALYRSIPNADGYGWIDFDPGGWWGSPSSEFVNLFVENRKLLDKHHERPKGATLFYFMDDGWGTGTEEQNFRETLRGITEKVRGPYAFLPRFPVHFKVAEELEQQGLRILEHCVYLNHGVLEPEPGMPMTLLTFKKLNETVFATAPRYRKLEGAMAAAQTFVIQLPNFYYYFSSLWDERTQAADQLSVLRSLGRLVLPAHAELLASSWGQLAKPGAADALQAARQVEAVIGTGDAGRAGILGGYVFPDVMQILRDLRVMLRIHGNAEQLRERVQGGAPEQQVLDAVTAYLREMLNWQKTNGFFGAYGINRTVIFDNFMHGLDFQTATAAWEKYTRGRADRRRLETVVLDNLSRENFERRVLAHLPGQFFGTHKMGIDKTHEEQKIRGAKSTVP